MTSYDPSTYGDQIADVYDALYGDHDPSAIALLAELAGQGPVLELGIGTGRLALPLSERGVAVHGIDASAAMIEKLRKKPGGADIPVVLGDFSRVAVEKRFSLIFIAFNTFFGLQTQEEQIRCFRTVASQLSENGLFLMEGFVPDTARFDRGQRLAVSRIEPDKIWLEAARHNAAMQLVDSQLVRLSSEGVTLFPVRIRYAWPAELDLMAQLAGLELRNRWGGWQRQPFSSASYFHVSVYARMR
jgi:SAM-dependent methyltransferase